MAATYRQITAASFEEAKRKLKTNEGETLVVANKGGHPKNGHIPVTCWQTFEDHKASCTFYARKG
jgi:hypothetical protein